MRWLILALAGLVALSVGLSWLHPPAMTVGRELAEAVERVKGVTGAGELRGAVGVVDYLPDESLVAGVRGEVVGRGEEMGSGTLLFGEAINSKYVQWKDARFTWQDGRDGNGVERLRAAYAEGSAGRARVWRALGKMEYSAEGAAAAMQKGVASLDGLSDAGLHEAWLRADRAVLIQTDDLVDAVREALLLAARPERGPVLAFRSGGEEVFALPLEPSGNTQWVEISAYTMDGKAVWDGVMRMETKDGTSPDFARLRVLMAAAGEEASGGPLGLKAGE